MLKLLITLAIAAALYLFFFNDNHKIEEKGGKEPEILFQPQDEKAEGIDPSIHKSSDLGRFACDFVSPLPFNTSPFGKGGLMGIRGIESSRHCEGA